MISDSMCAAGMPEGVYELGGQAVYVKDGKAALENGATIWLGSQQSGGESNA